MVQAPQRIDVAQLLEADREHLIHPLYYPADHSKPLVVVRGEGAEIIDADGKRYFDALSGLWNVHVGHGRAELAQVAADQMSTLAFNNNYVGCVNVPSTRLAEKLTQIAYPNLNAVYFTTSGAESIETELRQAEAHYENAIKGLEAIATTEQSELDPRTAATLQKNLAVIDQAISESRAAVRSEPSSEPAQQSLIEGFKTKIGLLQDTVALINEMRKGNEAGAARIVSGLKQKGN